MSKTLSKRPINTIHETSSDFFLKLSPESVLASGPTEIALSHSGLLLKADLKIEWRIDETGPTAVLVTKGFLDFKLPFQEKMHFQVMGRDFIDSHKNIQLDRFRFEDSKKYFGEWKYVDSKIAYEDHRKKFDFVFERAPQVIMSVGALLFCALRMTLGRAEGIYVGAHKLYALEFLKEKKDDKQNRVQVFHSHYGEAFEKKTLAANLYVETASGKLIGGDVYLPVIGKISF